MKKSTLVAGVIVALAAAYGASSWYVGQQAQNRIETAIADGNSRLGKVLGEELSSRPVQLSVSRYDRGWFSSSIIYSLKFTDAAGKVSEYLLADELQHGPLPWSALTKGQFTPVLAISDATLMPTASSQRWFDALGGKSPLHIASKLGFSGAGQSQWHFEALEFSTDEQAKVSFGGGQIDMTFASGFETVTTRGEFPSLSARLPDGDSVAIDAVTIHKSYAFGDNQNAEVRFEATDLRYVGTDGQTLRFEGFSLTGKSAEQSGLFDGNAQYAAKGVHVSDINLGTVSAAFQVNRLDLKALQALTTEYDAILAEQGVSDNDLADLGSKETLRLRGHVFELLKSRPSLALEPFEWDNGEGKSSVSAKVDFVRPDFALIDATDNEILLKALGQVDVSVSLSKSMVAKTYAQIMSEGEAPERAHAKARMMFDMYAGLLVRSGLASYVDGVLTSALVYKNEQFVINGKTMTVPELLDSLSLNGL